MILPSKPTDAMIQLEREIFSKPLEHAPQRTLCLLRKENFSRVKSLKFAWRPNNGQPENGMQVVMNHGELQAATSLIKQGLIVPTFPRDVDNATRIQPLEHTRNVQWAHDGEDIVIIKLSKFSDSILRLDKNQQHAVNLLLQKLANQEAWKMNPREIKDETGKVIDTVSPITQDPAAYQLDLRSKGPA